MHIITPNNNFHKYFILNLLYLFPSDFLSPSTLLVLLYQHWINFFTSFKPSPNSFILASYILLVNITNYLLPTFTSLPPPSITPLPFISFLCTHLSIINNLTLSTSDHIPFFLSTSMTLNEDSRSSSSSCLGWRRGRAFLWGGEGWNWWWVLEDMALV